MLNNCTNYSELILIAAASKSPKMLFRLLKPYANGYTLEERLAFKKMLRALDKALSEVRGEDAATEFWRLWRQIDIDY